MRGRLSVSTREISRGLAISAYTGSTGHEAASPHHAMVSDLIHDRLGSSRAKGTFKAYGSAWNSYLKICSRFDIIAEPVTESKLIAYVALAHEYGDILGKTIRDYTSAIAFRHRLLDENDPRGDGSMLRLVIDGCMRTDAENGYLKKVRLAISGDDLVRLIVSLDLTNFREARFAAYAVLSYFGGFRANELVESEAGLRCLWGDVNINPRSGATYILLLQRLSKGLPFGPTINIALPITSGRTCPLGVLTNYQGFFDKSKILPTMPLFMDTFGKAYTYKDALTDMRLYLRRIGLDGELYGTQSFRIGLATQAGKANIPDSILQLLGRWKSDCFKIYIKTDPSELADYARRLKGVGG